MRPSHKAVVAVVIAVDIVAVVTNLIIVAVMVFVAAVVIGAVVIRRRGRCGRHNCLAYCSCQSRLSRQWPP